MGVLKARIGTQADALLLNQRRCSLTETESYMTLIRHYTFLFMSLGPVFLFLLNYKRDRGVDTVID